MASVEKVNLCFRQIPLVAFRFGQVKRWVELTPDHQKSWLPLTHPRLPLRVRVNVGAVVIKEVALNLRLDGLAQKGKFIRPEIRIIAPHGRIAPDMACPRRRQRQEIRAKRT